MIRRRSSWVKRLLFFGALMGLLLGPSEVHAQSGTRSPWAVATGGGASAMGAATSSIYTNPAHLTIGETAPVLEIRLLDLRAYAGGDLLQFDHYSRAFGAQSGALTDAEESELLDAWFGGESRSVATYAEVVPFAIAYRPPEKSWALGASLRARSVSKTEINRGIFDLFLVGADSNRTVPVNGRYRAFNTVDLTASFGYAFDAIPLSVGASARLIFGTTFADGRLNSTVTITDSVLTHNFDYTARAAGGFSQNVYDTFNAFSGNPLGGVTGGAFGGNIAGLGVGVDLGASYAVRPDLHVSMSITDLGTIQWSRYAQRVTPENNTFRFDGVELNVSRLQDEFDGDVGAYFKHQVDSLARAAYEDVQRKRSSFASGLPTALNFGGTWLQSRLTLTGGMTLGISETAGAVSASPAFHVGGEYRLGPVPLRAGLRLGGAQAVTLSGGVGLHVGNFQFDLAGSATPSTSALGAGARYSVGLSVATVRF